MTAPVPEKTIHVWGLPVVDHLTVSDDSDRSSGGVIRNSYLAGGAALTTSLLKAMVPPDCSELAGVSVNVGRPSDGGSDFTWGRDAEVVDKFREQCCKPFKIDEVPHRWTTCLQDGTNQVPRYREISLGKIEQKPWTRPHSPEKTGRAELLVIDDPSPDLNDPDNLGELANYILNSNCEIIYKAARVRPDQVTKHSLLGSISKNTNSRDWMGRVTVVTTIEDLRALRFWVTPSISWEMLFTDLVRELLKRDGKLRQLPNEDGLGPFGRVIIRIGLAAAVIFDSTHHQSSLPEATLVFDKRKQEGDFEARWSGSGGCRMSGYSTCLVAALATAWAEHRDKGDEEDWWLKGTRGGLHMACLLLQLGYRPTVVESTTKITQTNVESNTQILKFPYKQLASEYFTSTQIVEDDQFAKYVDANPNRTELAKSWTILAKTWKTQEGSILGLARSVATQGPERALKDIPVHSFESWSSADRGEIEGVRSANNVIRQYLNEGRRRADPLGIAVFGPPGAGKSFLVEQLARHNSRTRDGASSDEGKVEFMPFNLSLFQDASHLHQAFHRVSDTFLKGAIPLVFWDEFDCSMEQTSLFWLKHFLSPLHDGEFFDGKHNHPIGKGIHVFAGGTNPNFERFTQAVNDFPDSKGADFVRRLSAHINIVGIDATDFDSSAAEDPGRLDKPLDLYYPIRRAFLIYALLQKETPHKWFDIDPNLLDALLLTPKYANGASSLAAIVKMSNVRGNRFAVSDLPPMLQLGKHTKTPRLFETFVEEPETIMQYANKGELTIELLGEIKKHVTQDPTQLKKLLARIVNPSKGRN